MKPELQAVFDAVKARDPDQPEFLQAVEEVIESLEPLFEKYPKYLKVSTDLDFVNLESKWDFCFRCYPLLSNQNERFNSECHGWMITMLCK